MGLPDGAGTKRQADTALAELVTEVGNDQVAKHQPGTLADLLRQWLETVAAERSAYTMEEFRRMTATNIEPAIGAVRLEKLTDARLDGFYRDLIKRGLSPASVKHNHALVHAALGRAVKWGMIPSNPADRATPPQALTRSTVSAPAVGDVQRLLAVTETESPIVAAAVALAAVTGARRGELCALRWSRGLVTANPHHRPQPDRHQRSGDGRGDQDPPEKDTGPRRCPAGPPSPTSGRSGGLCRNAGVALVAGPFILSPSADGARPYAPDTLTDYYKWAAKRLGIRAHFHELRHFSATTAIASGADVRTVAGRLGHADASLTLRVYAHALEARDRDLAGLLGAAVLGPADRRPKPKADDREAPAPASLARVRSIT